MAKERILIVEDDSGISDFVNLELQHEGFDTEVADNGRIALEKFEAFNPDLILLDIMLPELSGLEVICFIQSLLHSFRRDELDEELNDELKNQPFV